MKRLGRGGLLAGLAVMQALGCDGILGSLRDRSDDTGTAGSDAGADASTGPGGDSGSSVNDSGSDSSLDAGDASGDSASTSRPDSAGVLDDAGGLQTGAAWPMIGHDPAHTGLSPYTGPQNPMATPVWSFTCSGAAGSPVIGSDGTIYFGSGTGMVYAVNPGGTQRWARQVGSSQFTTPAIAGDGTLYMACADSNLYALHPDGSMKWTFHAGGPFGRSSPVVAPDGTVYVGADDHDLYAINPDGTKKWTFATGGNVDTAPALGATGTIYVGSTDDNVYAVSPGGSQAWAFATGSAVGSTPSVGASGDVYIGSNDNSLYALAAGGAMSWQATLCCAMGPTAIGPGGTVVVSTYNSLAVYDGTSGAILSPAGWNIGNDNWGGGIVNGADGTVYLISNHSTTCQSDNHSRLLGFTADATTTKFTWWLPQSCSTGSNPALGADGTLYLGTSDGQLHAIHD